MRQSRYVWLMGLAILCLAAIIAFRTPQTVISTLVDPNYRNSPQATIQYFWNLMDLRQTKLARELLISPQLSSDEKEFEFWETKLNNDPMLSLQKVDFVNSESDNTSTELVEVTWTSPIQEIQQAAFSMNLKLTEKGWRIQSLRRIKDFSLGG